MLLMTHNTFWSVPNAVCATANGGIVSVGNSAVRVTREVLLIKGFAAHDYLQDNRAYANPFAPRP